MYHNIKLWNKIDLENCTGIKLGKPTLWTVESVWTEWIWGVGTVLSTDTQVAGWTVTCYLSSTTVYTCKWEKLHLNNWWYLIKNKIQRNLQLEKLNKCICIKWVVFFACYYLQNYSVPYFLIFNHIPKHCIIYLWINLTCFKIVPKCLPEGQAEQSEANSSPVVVSVV